MQVEDAQQPSAAQDQLHTHGLPAEPGHDEERNQWDLDDDDYDVICHVFPLDIPSAQPNYMAKSVRVQGRRVARVWQAQAQGVMTYLQKNWTLWRCPSCFCVQLSYGITLTT